MVTPIFIESEMTATSGTSKARERRFKIGEPRGGSIT
jgi:hypothetical protein